MSREPRPIRRPLITGVSGSGGSYLAEHILLNHPDVEVHGLTRWHSTSSQRNLSGLGNRIHLHECDLLDFSSLVSALRAARPDAIFHLASLANVRAAFQTPLAIMQNNVMATANLLEAVRQEGLDPLIQICSTSEVYGQVDPARVPIKEDCPTAPVNPYAVSKLAQDALGFAYFKSYGMKVIRTRMFSYINPRRPDLSATAFAMQIARMERGLQKELLHGNLDSTRTFIDVRDAMESYWVATVLGEVGEVYNIGGSKIISVGALLELLIGQARCKIPTRMNPNLLRPTDVTNQIPDASKFRQATGWAPKYSFEESVTFLLETCRGYVAAEESPV